MAGEPRRRGPLLLSSDIFVSPSWAESFPYSVLEAMAVGAPIVATDVGGVSEAIEDQVTGVWSPLATGWRSR